MSLGSLTCCGVREYHGIRCTPQKIVEEVFDELLVDDDKFAFVLFTDIRDTKRGLKLARFINQHNLGEVVSSRKKVNPNTDNPLKMWTWTPNQRSLKAHIRKTNESLYRKYLQRNDTTFDPYDHAVYGMGLL